MKLTLIEFELRRFAQEAVTYHGQIYRSVCRRIEMPVEVPLGNIKRTILRKL
jgi:hypothetical protein